MHTTEAERILLIQKREEIRIVSQEIIDLITKEKVSNQDIIAIKKNFIQILSLISIVKSYLKSNVMIDKEKQNEGLRSVIIGIFADLGEYPKLNETEQLQTRIKIQVLCVLVNTIQFWNTWWPSRVLAYIYPLGGLDIQK